MAKEIEARAKLAYHLEEPQKTVEAHLLAEELVNYIYNAEITEYSACFHLLANLQGEKDIGIVSTSVGILSRLVLNAPVIAFKSAQKNIRSYADKMGLSMSGQEVSRLIAALEAGNRGALFYLIVVMLPEQSLRSKRWFMSQLDAALKSIGLSIDKIKRGAHQEAKFMIEGLTVSKSETIKALAYGGYENFKKVFPHALEYTLENLSLPPSLLGDADMTPYLFNNSESNALHSLDLEVAYNEMVELQLRAENFAEACL